MRETLIAAKHTLYDMLDDGTWGMANMFAALRTLKGKEPVSLTTQDLLCKKALELVIEEHGYNTHII